MIFNYRSSNYFIYGFIALLFLMPVVYILDLLLQEDLYVKKGSLGYYITITSSLIKDFPIINAESEINYYSSSGDGAKPQMQGLEYKSKENLETLKSKLIPYIVSKGYNIDPQLKSTNRVMYFTDNKTRIDLLIFEKNNINEIKCYLKP